MSGADPYRPPAWAGLAPRAPEYRPADPPLASAIAAAFGRAGSVSVLANANPHSPRALKVEDDRGGRLFVKIVPASRLKTLLAGEAIARWLQQLGAPVVAAIDLNPPALPGGDYLVAYPFCDGVSPGSDPLEARAIGESLALLHRMLGRHPDRRQWDAATDARIRRLQDVRAALAGGRLRAGPDPDRLAAVAANNRMAFDSETFEGESPRRPLHGDLNVFNMLLTDRGVVFLDFEDVVHSVLPAVFELALVCERVVLAAEADDGAARTSVRELLRAYEAAGGDSVGPVERFPDVLAGLALRSLCTLAAIDPQGTDAAEWAKFFFLADQAAARRGVFA